MQNGFPQHIGTVLTLYCKDLLADYWNTPRTNLFFDDRFQFFYNVQRFHIGSKFFDQLFRQRVYQTKLQHRCVRQGFPYILIGDTAGDDTNFLVAVFHTVDVKMTGIFRHLLQPLFHDHMPFLRIRRHQYIFFNVLFIGLVRYVFPFLRMYHTL